MMNAAAPEAILVRIAQRARTATQSAAQFNPGALKDCMQDLQNDVVALQKSPDVSASDLRAAKSQVSRVADTIAFLSTQVNGALCAATRTEQSTYRPINGLTSDVFHKALMERYG